MGRRLSEFSVTAVLVCVCVCVRVCCYTYILVARGFVRIDSRLLLSPISSSNIAFLFLSPYMKVRSVQCHGDPFFASNHIVVTRVQHLHAPTRYSSETHTLYRGQEEVRVLKVERRSTLSTMRNHHGRESPRSSVY